MRILKLTSVFVVLIVTSCKKENVTSNSMTNRNPNQEKSVKNVPPCTLVLIPNGGTSRIGFMPDGVNPFGTTSTNYNLLDGITVDGNPAVLIYNPNLFLGLSNNLNGTVFSGLAVDRSSGGGIYSPSVILSRSRSSEHALFFATLDANYNYIISNYLIVSASFAPSNSGWSLRNIEYESSINKFYGIFYNGTTLESKVAEINKTTGVATQIKSFSNVRFCGMDFSYDTNGVPNFMYLLTGNAAGNTICKVYQLNLSNLNVIINTTTIPMYYNSSASFTGGGFLALGKHTTQIYIYDSNNFGIQGYNFSSNSTMNFISQKHPMYLSYPGPIISEGSPVNFTGGIITDAGN